VSAGRRLRGAAIAGVAAATLAAPAAAQDAPVGEEQLRESVRTLEIRESIQTIDLDDSVESLRSERVRGNRVNVSISADVLFEFDRARLTPDANATLERVAGRIRAARGPVRVDGHTDSIGSTTYNLGLSRRRAAAVSDALRAALPAGVAIRARGFGEARPVAPNTVAGDDNPEGRARNRRVTISYPRP
jgi:outer membrane protein OmpA-like peptidoglycan-associated protein